MPTTTGHYPSGLSAFCTPATPQQSNPTKTFDWLFATDQSQKDVFSQLINEHLKGSSTMETPATPSIDINGLNKVTRRSKEDDDDEQNFYSAPPSRIFIPNEIFKKKVFPLATQQDGSLSLFSNRSVDKSSFPASLENWFGTSIYTKAYPSMPCDRVLSACDLEQ